MKLRHLILPLAAMLPMGVAQASAQDLKTLNVGILKMAALTDAWVAQQNGIFKKNGLNVNLVEFRSGSEAVAAQQSGSTDIILSIPGTAMTAVERGFDLRAIFQNEVAKQAGPDSGAIEVAVNSPIKTLADLAGKRVAVSALHSQNTVGVQMLIKDAGVDLSNVQLLELPYPSQADGLRHKQVDAVATVDPYTTQLQSMGIGRVLSWNYVATIPGQPLGAWFAKRAFIAKNADVIQRFNQSLKEAIDDLNADPQRARAAVVAFTGLNPTLVSSMPPVGWSYKVDPAKWQQVVDLMQKSGELRKPHKAEDFMAAPIDAYLVH
jgi:NitT/TauT family transport system substrate-binding protein